MRNLALASLSGHLLRAVSPTLSLAVLTALSDVGAADLSFEANPGAAIADGNASGFVSLINVSPGSGVITDVNVTLDLEGIDPGGWNGDLYIYLAHEGALSVLLNRPGVSAINPWGYGDNGLANLLFDDEAAQGDVHVYQATLGVGDTSLPLTGSWQPDARATDPDSVLTSDPRSLLLGEFDGLSADGEWRLFVADLSPGAAFRLSHWKLDLTVREQTLVPEPPEGVVGAATLLTGLVFGWTWRRRRRSGA